MRAYEREYAIWQESDIAMGSDGKGKQGCIDAGDDGKGKLGKGKQGYEGWKGFSAWRPGPYAR